MISLPGSEALIAAATGLIGLFTWSHQQRQQVLDRRFQDMANTVRNLEDRIDEIPAIYATRAEMDSSLADIRQRLLSIDEKLDRVLLKGF